MWWCHWTFHIWFPIDILGWHLIWNIVSFLIFIRFPPSHSSVTVFLCQEIFLASVHSHLTSYLVRFVSCIFNLVSTFIWIKLRDAKSYQQYMPKLYFQIQYLNKKQYMCCFLLRYWISLSSYSHSKYFHEKSQMDQMTPNCLERCKMKRTPYIFY